MAGEQKGTRQSMNIQNAHKGDLDTNFVEWQKSPFSGPPDNQCVEVSITGNAVGLRDSTKPAGAVLVFTHGEWEAFLRGVVSGSFRLPGAQ
ncbi:DUF397 domain-containing protein [Actinosynnema sp. CS-041913]|uniref:DUF397 domain-containing protein n=1 Tax=Actinosynnema sp. CS-041913 TaxID=3239917 RepID=UPI003D8FD782